MTTFEPKDIKPGYVLGLQSECGKTLAMVTYGQNGEPCVSSKGIWFPLKNLDGNLNYKSISVSVIYGYSHNATAYCVSTEGREVLWKRREEQEKEKDNKVSVENAGVNKYLWLFSYCERDISPKIKKLRNITEKIDHNKEILFNKFCNRLFFLDEKYYYCAMAENKEEVLNRAMIALRDMLRAKYAFLENMLSIKIS